MRLDFSTCSHPRYFFSLDFFVSLGFCARAVLGRLVFFSFDPRFSIIKGGQGEHSLGGKIPRAQSHPESHPKPTQTKPKHTKTQIRPLSAGPTF